VAKEEEAVVAKEGAKEEAVAVGLDDDDDDYCMFDVQNDAYYYDHDNIHDDDCSF